MLKSVMTNFMYENGSKIILGNYGEDVLAGEIKNRDAKKVLIHYGGQSVIKSGLFDRIKGALGNAGIKWVEYGGVVANPLKGHALKGVELAKKEKVDFVLAVGGGSVIDSAKLICAGAVNDDIWSYYLDSKKVITGALPLGVVLTIPAAGSECSISTVIRDEETGRKHTMMHNVLRSKFAFINPEYCFTLPKEQIAFGASDILAHMLERYFSPEQNVVTTDKILTGAIHAVMEIAPRVYADKADYANMAEFCLLGTLAHNGMLALGRVIQSWESHMIEMGFISGHYNFAHGQGLSIIFPAWLKYMATKRPEKVKQFEKEVVTIKELEKWYKSLDLPTRLSDLNIDVMEAKEVIKKSFKPDVKLGGYGELSLDDILAVVRLAK